MWPAGAGTKLPCPRDSALRRAAFSGNLTALPSHLVPAGRSVRVFISANPEGKSLGALSRSVGPSFDLRGSESVWGPHSGVRPASLRSLPPSAAPKRVGISFQSLNFLELIRSPADY